MSWVGSWLGKYVGNWLGTTSTGSTTAVVVPALLTLAATTAIVFTGAYVQATPLVVQLSATTPVIHTGNVTTPIPLVVVLNLNTVAASAGVAVNPITLELDVVLTSATIQTSAQVDAQALAVSVVLPNTAVVTGAVATPTALSTALSLPSVIALTGALHNAVPLQVTIDLVSPVVYDRNGSINYIKAFNMKVNIPEIIAFSTDITTDMLVIEAMEDDMSYMDGTQSVKLLRKTDNVVIDYTLGTAIPENKIYTFEHALIRQVSERDNRAVKQLRLFMQSVQNDEITTLDTIIELPKRDDVQIKSGDQIQSDLQGTKYTVIAVDDCTLKTRWRIGARKIV